MLSKPCVDPLRDEKRVWKADDLYRLINTSPSVSILNKIYAYCARNENVVIPPKTFAEL